MKNRTKNRTVLYGYRYEAGKLIRSEEEIDILLRICRRYLDGQSLQSIADALNAEQVSYQPGVTGWNKSRLIRLLTDERYTGEKGYPSIWSSGTRTQICSMRDGKNTQRNLDRNRGVYPIAEPIVCAACETVLCRRKSRCRNGWEDWHCPECGIRLTLAEDRLPAAVTEILNAWIAHPDRIACVPATYEPSASARQAEADIRYQIFTHSTTREESLRHILECVSGKYAELPSVPAITEIMKADLSQTGLLSAYSKPLCNRIVERILLHRDGRVQLQLVNGQIAGEENS